MALSQAGWMATATAILGVLSFIFGVIGENKKPAQGTPITEGGRTVCTYPNDPSIALGSLSMIFLLLASIMGVTSIFFPYNKKPVPITALTRRALLVVFTILSFALFFVGEVLLMWVTISEIAYRVHNIHNNSDKCPTAKTGVMGGAAFLCLDAALFWLICQMLTLNAREDHFSYDDDEKGSYGHVTSAPPPQLDTSGAAHTALKA